MLLIHDAGLAGLRSKHVLCHLLRLLLLLPLLAPALVTPRSLCLLPTSLVHLFVDPIFHLLGLCIKFVLLFPNRPSNLSSSLLLLVEARLFAISWRIAFSATSREEMTASPPRAGSFSALR